MVTGTWIKTTHKLQTLEKYRLNIMKSSRDSLFKWICDEITGIGKTNTADRDDTKNRHKA